MCVCVCVRVSVCVGVGELFSMRAGCMVDAKQRVTKN